MSELCSVFVLFPFQTCGRSDRDTICSDSGQSTERAEQLCDADQHVPGTVSTHFSTLSSFFLSSHLFLSSLFSHLSIFSIFFPLCILFFVHLCFSFCFLPLYLNNAKLHCIKSLYTLTGKVNLQPLIMKSITSFCVCWTLIINVNQTWAGYFIVWFDTACSVISTCLHIKYQSTGIPTAGAECCFIDKHHSTLL